MSTGAYVFAERDRLKDELMLANERIMLDNDRIQELEAQLSSECIFKIQISSP